MWRSGIERESSRSAGRTLLARLAVVGGRDAPRAAEQRDELRRRRQAEHRGDRAEVEVGPEQELLGPGDEVAPSLVAHRGADAGEVPLERAHAEPDPARELPDPEGLVRLAERGTNAPQDLGLLEQGR